MAYKYYLGVVDYAAIVLTLLISAGIGIYFRYFGNNQKTTKDYFMAGKNMAKIPVIISISVTMTSAISMLGTPSEIYRYGLQPVLMNLGLPIGIALAAFIFIPVYFEYGVSTVYEFLEVRYGRVTRYVVSSLFILQMVLYMSSVLYAPVLALNAVTNLSIELSIIVFGTICTFYCAMGGLKAVLWSDVFQSILMFIAILALYAVGIREAGGLMHVYDRASRGSRLNLFE
ncbi:putative sodium-dependent multivitamin transporter [Nephila pilipes]|uniref:Putative sodium-dependent multivitamin transporter n=1 Tax=Nephila pilipes TaxID=299642 RepID=A0A8X6NIR2_NEPPI|nr:putative sodium-dependent multivitamin transporter [Nephila pilipes]